MAITKSLHHKPKTVEIFKQPQNGEDSFDFNDFEPNQSRRRELFSQKFSNEQRNIIEQNVSVRNLFCVENIGTGIFQFRFILFQNKLVSLRCGHLRSFGRGFQ